MENKKQPVGRPRTIKKEGDRKKKYAASLTPNQHKKMVKLFPKTSAMSSFEQVVLYALTHKEKESLLNNLAV